MLFNNVICGLEGTAGNVNALQIIIINTLTAGFFLHQFSSTSYSQASAVSLARKVSDD